MIIDKLLLIIIFKTSTFQHVIDLKFVKSNNIICNRLLYNDYKTNTLVYFGPIGDFQVDINYLYKSIITKNVKC